MSWTLTKKLDTFAGRPGEIKRREVVLDPQVSPEKTTYVHHAFTSSPIHRSLTSDQHGRLFRQRDHDHPAVHAGEPDPDQAHADQVCRRVQPRPALGAVCGVGRAHSRRVLLTGESARNPGRVRLHSS